MKNNISTSLENKLNNAIAEYIKIFENKHDIEFEDWVAGDIGTIACFVNGTFINFDDIRFDLENSIDKNKFFKWYSLTLDLALEKKPIINYKTFLKIK